MLKLGNLIPYSPYNDKSNFNVYDSVHEASFELPTLIVGWENVKQFYSEDRIDALDRRLDDNVFWTFSMNEDRKFHELDTYYFLERCYTQLMDSANYIAVDPFHRKLGSLKKIYRKLNKMHGLIGYKYYDTFYIASENYIFGFDIEVYDRLGLRSALSKRVKNMVDVIFDEEKNGMIKRYSEHLQYMNNEVKYVPYLILKNEYGKREEEHVVG